MVLYEAMIEIPKGLLYYVQKQTKLFQMVPNYAIMSIYYNL